MTERPIIFSAPMVRAILEGRKTQTRRIVKPQPEPWALYPADNGPDGEFWWTEHDWDDDMMRHWPTYEHGLRCPYGVPGDTLWVRESFCVVPTPAGANRYYAADMSWAQSKRFTWRPSIHMPRAAARILLTVKAVRVERLREISENDAIAEGAEAAKDHEGWSYFAGFRALWDSINAKRAPWASNPWVWVITFGPAP